MSLTRALMNSTLAGIQQNNIMSEHPLPLLKSLCDSGISSSASCCRWSCRILAITLPTKSSREIIPLHLSHLDRSPFLGIGISTIFVQSLGADCCFQVVCTRSSSQSTKPGLWQATFNISSRVPELPPAFPFLSLPTFPTSSSSDGFSADCGFIGRCLILSSSSWLN